MKKQTKSNAYPVAMTVAGSDSGGGAGIQADLRTFNAFGVFGCAAIAAITSQNPRGVSRIDAIPAAGVAAQIAAVLDAIKVKWGKTGMLFNADIVKAVAGAVEQFSLKLVADPVMVSTSGSVLLEEPAIAAFKQELLPKVKWLTPNIPEAELLLGRKINDSQSCRDAAREFYEKWGVSTLLKTGHASFEPEAADYVCNAGSLFRLCSPRIAVPKLAAHGTGCTLSAALTATLALDMPWKSAICEAKAFVLGSLTETVEIGDGLQAMYPPVEDYFDSVKLDKL